MQAVIAEKDKPFFESLIKEGLIYEINRPFVGKMKKSYNAVSANAMINFGQNTKITEIVNSISAFPLNYFDFQPFESLEIRLDNNYVLTGTNYDIITKYYPICSILLRYIHFNFNFLFFTCRRNWNSYFFDCYNRRVHKDKSRSC